MFGMIVCLSYVTRHRVMLLLFYTYGAGKLLNTTRVFTKYCSSRTPGRLPVAVYVHTTFRAKPYSLRFERHNLTLLVHGSPVHRFGLGGPGPTWTRKRKYSRDKGNRKGSIRNKCVSIFFRFNEYFCG